VSITGKNTSGSILRELTLDAERGYQQVGQVARSTMS
jgi:hypothetical protein